MNLTAPDLSRSVPRSGHRRGEVHRGGADQHSGQESHRRRFVGQDISGDAGTTEIEKGDRGHDENAEQAPPEGRVAHGGVDLRIVRHGYANRGECQERCRHTRPSSAAPI